MDRGEKSVTISVTDVFSERNGPRTGYSIVVTKDKLDPALKTASLPTWGEVNSPSSNKKSYQVSMLL